MSSVEKSAYIRSAFLFDQRANNFVFVSMLYTKYEGCFDFCGMGCTFVCWNTLAISIAVSGLVRGS